MYKVKFEADVSGLASVKRYEDEIYVRADSPKAARDKAESYIKSAYSDSFSILFVVPLWTVE